MIIEVSDETWQMIFETACFHSERPCDDCVIARKSEHLKSTITVTSINPV